MNILENYGLKDIYIEEAKKYSNFKLARIIAQYKGLYKIITECDEKLAEVSGKFRYEATESIEFPAVGDYVMVSFDENDSKSIIHKILTRKTMFSRTAVGTSDQVQIIATNIDIVFICMSLNENYNLNRLERYLSITWDSGAVPVIVLTKSDLSKNLFKYIQEVEEISAFSDIIVTTFEENNIDKFKKYLKKDITTAFIGSSGVGKSTLINEILGETRLETKEISKGDKGKHTTTGREMFVSPFGGVIIDTPGMREIGIQSTDISKYFLEMEDLVNQCKFNNCSHTDEPGCAVKKALFDGLIDERRIENYFKLKRESSYDGLTSKELEHKKLNQMFKEVGGLKNARKFIKDKQKRK
ncbi:ribosome small subunit-dependent GTPase A [Cetobacterium sp.]|uniref:ribosome small subunit-dependent GTPase A n=1 Tax=Cetobacterium sp. TaxID=2071632 RepID=UPI003AF10A63